MDLQELAAASDAVISATETRNEVSMDVQELAAASDGVISATEIRNEVMFYVLLTDRYT